MGKVTGATKYMGDLTFPGMLWGRVLRAAHPHALIKSIDTSKAEKVPGVVRVLTHKDVKGLNGYGIAVPDQPVLCHDKVRYMGDAVALVIAETREEAAAALTGSRWSTSRCPWLTPRARHVAGFALSTGAATHRTTHIERRCGPALPHPPSSENTPPSQADARLPRTGGGGRVRRQWRRDGVLRRAAPFTATRCRSAAPWG